MKNEETIRNTFNTQMLNILFVKCFTNVDIYRVCKIWVGRPRFGIRVKKQSQIQNFFENFNKKISFTIKSPNLFSETIFLCDLINSKNQ